MALSTAWVCAVNTIALVGFFGYRLGVDPMMDFATFYLDGRAWLAQAPLYQHANLNTPLITIALFSPLAALSFRAAQIAWTVLGVVPLALAIRTVANELRLSLRQVTSLTLIVLAVHGTWVNLWLGQTGWFMLWAMTGAWRWSRSNSYFASGLWLGAAIAIKPPLVLVALLLPWRTCAVAGALSAVVSSVGVLITGWEPWLEWYRSSGQTTLVNGFGNGSLWGMWARMQTGEIFGMRLEQLHPAAWLIILAVGIGLTGLTMTERTPDRRLALAILTFLLLSPLAWPHYALMLVGPLTALWLPASGGFALAIVLSALPVWPAWLALSDLTDRHIVKLILGSVQTAATVAALVSVAAGRFTRDVSRSHAMNQEE